MTTLVREYHDTISAEDLLIFDSLDMKAPSCDNCSSMSCPSCAVAFDSYIHQLMAS